LFVEGRGMKKVLFLLLSSFSLIYSQRMTYSVPSRPWLSRSTDPVIQKYMNKTKAFDQKVEQLHKDFAPILMKAFNLSSYPDWAYKPHTFSTWSLDDLMSAVEDAKSSFIFIKNRLKAIADLPVLPKGFESQIGSISWRVSALDNAANKLLANMRSEQARLQEKERKAPRQFYTQVASQPLLFKFSQTRWQAMHPAQPRAIAAEQRLSELD